MSLKKHVKFQSLALKENLSFKKQLNLLWKQFMSSFGYKKYYNYSKDYNINNTSYDIINNESRNLSMKIFKEFLEENSIIIVDNHLIANNKIGIAILSEAKIWIMFIIYVNKINENKNMNNNDIVMNIFKDAIKNGCDIISLFEFFLIFISEKNYLFNNEDINIKKIKEIIPNEFIMIYFNKKEILRNIFQKDEYKYVNMRNSLTKFLTNDIMETHSTVFSSEEKEKNKNKNLDLNDIIIISKDYLNKGFFMLFKDKKDIKEKNEISILNSFIEYDLEEDDNYCLMPLLIKYQNYEQKMEANNTLNLINKSIYKNYTYYPYDINIINKL